MKKLLTLTILLTTFIQADEEANKNNPDICYSYPKTIIDFGIKPCKENDIFVLKIGSLKSRDIEQMHIFCKVGTIDTATASCILRAEKDFAKEIDHFDINIY